MKNLETYKEYEIEQWLEDADFVGWVKNPTGNAGAFFTSLMAKDVQLARRMAAAMQILQGIANNEPTLSDKSIEKMWENVRSETVDRRKKHRSINEWIRIGSIAASILLVNNSPFEIATEKKGGLEVSLQYIITEVKPLRDYRSCPVY